MMEKSKTYQHGFDMGLNAALALLARHLDDVPGFDGDKFRQDLAEVAAIEKERFPSPQSDEGLSEVLSGWDSNDHMHGYTQPIQALSQKGLGAEVVELLEARRYIEGDEGDQES